MIRGRPRVRVSQMIPIWLGNNKETAEAFLPTIRGEPRRRDERDSLYVSQNSDQLHVTGCLVLELESHSP